MIPRYSRPEMRAIWEPETRFRIWFEIEAHAASAMAELGIVPKEAAKTIWEKGSKAKFDVARIAAGLGGGGHRNAAGFSVSLAEWLERFVSDGVCGQSGRR